MKEVELTTGRVVQVFIPSLSRAYALAAKKFPEPQPPVRSSPTAAGGEITMAIVDDPEYLEAHEKWEEDIQVASEEAILLLALKKEKPPEDFSLDDIMDTILYFDPEFTPREGAVGLRLDWFEWDLLSNVADWAEVQRTIQNLLGIEEEVVDQTEESFPGDVEGEASGSLADDEETAGGDEDVSEV